MIQQSNFIQQPHIFNSVTNSVVHYLISQSYIIKQSHTFNSVTNSSILSRFTFSSHSTVPYIQPCDQFNCFISFYILIYFKSVQIHMSYLIPKSNFIQQSHIFKSATKSIVLSRFKFILISFNNRTYSTVSQIQ